ncbi:hypothetical protein HD553DRAFT_255600, partial [Filobasidium floriforme]|uniref:uncharacterized protein n=1 Tax=Filobasidium floriforme TaxID=5210 RepID=UPI001E8D80DB
IWHRRLCHLNKQDVLKIAKDESFGVQIDHTKVGDAEEPCEACRDGKAHRQPHRGSHERAKGLLEVIHTDICQMEVEAIKGYRYFMVFIDE